ncbi:hypothetical protein TSUD_178230 [Trifolium subterraneum]|uniref:Uncharacterized protein n=1 Tax=Trifolium subterraneum TaxID=3900 RepID=A0A2Z6LIU3_TRISU|nr:hypothetical protein TSUD_178230 [Trifolium subterraneum]
MGDCIWFEWTCFYRWLSWKKGKQDVTWKTFERAFIKKFISDLWEMMEAAEDVHRVEIQEVKTNIGDISKIEKLQVKYAKKEIKSGSLQNLTSLDYSSDPSNRNWRATRNWWLGLMQQLR